MDAISCHSAKRAPNLHSYVHHHQVSTAAWLDEIALHQVAGKIKLNSETSHNTVCLIKNARDRDARYKSITSNFEKRIVEWQVDGGHRNFWKDVAYLLKRDPINLLLKSEIEDSSSDISNKDAKVFITDEPIYNLSHHHTESLYKHEIDHHKKSGEKWDIGHWFEEYWQNLVNKFDSEWKSIKISRRNVREIAQRLLDTLNDPNKSESEYELIKAVSRTLVIEVISRVKILGKCLDLDALDNLPSVRDRIFGHMILTGNSPPTGASRPVDTWALVLPDQPTQDPRNAKICRRPHSRGLRNAVPPERLGPCVRTGARDYASHGCRGRSTRFSGVWSDHPVEKSSRLVWPSSRRKVACHLPMGRVIRSNQHQTRKTLGLVR